MSHCNLCGETAQRPLFSAHGYDLVACAGCDLAYIANPPAEEKVAGLYTDVAHYHAPLRDPDSPEWKRNRRTAEQHLKFARKVLDGGRLLDVGCSTGQFLAMARDCGFAVEGIELNPQSAQAARLDFSLEVRCGRIEDAHFAHGSFGAVTLFDVIEHLPDPAGELARIRPLLRPGGVLIVSTPNIDGLFPRASLPAARALGYWSHPEPPHHLFQFSVKTMAAMLRKTGFTPFATAHGRIELAYTFGTLRNLLRMPKRLAYAAAFAPFALAGPWVGMGDWFYMAARRTD